MLRHQDGFVIAVCLAAGLALVANQGHHPSFGPMGWANAGGRSVSVGFMVNMIQLQVRQMAASVGSIISIR